MNIRNANLSFGSMSYGNNPQELDLHHAEASVCSVLDVHSWHKGNGWAGIGYHYFVRKNGEIWKGRPDSAIGAHVAGHNTNTLGICAEGSYMSEDMPQAQKNAIIELCKYLCNKYGINKIYGHREVGSSNCPGTKYPLAEIKNAVLNGGSSNNPGPVVNDNVRDKVGIITGSGVNVRLDPNGKILGSVNKGDKVKLYRLEGDWYHCYSLYSGYNRCYIYKNYVSIQGSSNGSSSGTNLDGKTGVINTPSGVNVRADKSTSSKILGTLSNGSKVQLYRKEGDWMHIYYPKQGGYVYAKYIRY
ncbi:N-acetylmuramoyl-L-alanine amidase [Clostridium botulinum]|uniref:Putative N-acetylmuramoyl-L-alanine amidase n=1 Tax=Clostridium botulinum (strain Langeland / NCTC 10281 / Type F) TaxID=441772 RepID=A7GI54_CLOBL|nr:N-acetylmuramoyl-L-alanine amidase [Clostridium botulinum]ABS41559.1 putative N-acetylmuramoyl-L-alanine amidase [Clostridium botulinum F str. Langeland]ADG00828.1 putative N-acetylmuramoyl-L-alanine amidase [Clostridium botulinum F str. 230613]KKM40665.1 N-acetylmuramoyl-L-alanine amidase [Clostridium botulinum]MBY6794359.1 N-acetylmuramoyl-L-alanine amidase [Clostridium botulinum]MBY6938147.1 N-acetylmuramoyl-L-alanine amidase [Clostridium botulinum]